MFMFGVGFFVGVDYYFVENFYLGFEFGFMWFIIYYGEIINEIIDVVGIIIIVIVFVINLSVFIFLGVMGVLFVIGNICLGWRF